MTVVGGCVKEPLPIFSNGLTILVWRAIDAMNLRIRYISLTN